MIPAMIQEWLKQYGETGNPLNVLKAYQTARRSGQRIPEEALQYFDEAADQILKMAADPPRPQDRPLAIAKALRLAKSGPGQGSEIGSFRDKRQALRLAMDSYKARQGWGEGKADYADEEAAKQHGISKAKVRRNFLAHLEGWQAKAEQGIKDGTITQNEDGKATAFIIGNADKLRETVIILQLAELHFSRIK